MLDSEEVKEISRFESMMDNKFYMPNIQPSNLLVNKKSQIIYSLKRPTLKG